VRAKAGVNDVKNYMHPQQFGPAFRQFIPCFRRFGVSPLTLTQALPTLSSLAAHYRRGDMKNGGPVEHPAILSKSSSRSVINFVS
jgi:hypothetical protein